MPKRDEELPTGELEKQKHCLIPTPAHPAGQAPVRAAYKNKIKGFHRQFINYPPYHIEGRNYGGDPGTKPRDLALGRRLNNISSEGQTWEDMANEPGQ